MDGQFTLLGFYYTTVFDCSDDALWLLSNFVEHANCKCIFDILSYKFDFVGPILRLVNIDNDRFFFEMKASKRTE